MALQPDASNRNANANDIIMDASRQLNTDVLFATARVQAALGIVSRIVGPKEEWGPWMREHLRSEHVSTLGLDEDKHRPIVNTFLEPDTER